MSESSPPVQESQDEVMAPEGRGPVEEENEVTDIPLPTVTDPIPETRDRPSEGGSDDV